MTGNAPTVSLALDSLTPYAVGSHIVATATVVDADTYIQLINGGLDPFGVPTDVTVAHRDTAVIVWSWKSTGATINTNVNPLTVFAPDASDILVATVTDAEGNKTVATVAITVQSPTAVGYAVEPIAPESVTAAVTRVGNLLAKGKAAVKAAAVRFYNRPGHGLTETPWVGGPIAAIPADAIPVISMKDSPDPVATPAYINAATRKWVWVIRHEPEGDLPVPQFKADQATGRKMVDASPNGHLVELAECYTGYAQRHGNKPGYMVKDMWGGTATILAMDLYRDSSLDGNTSYPDPKAFCSILVDTAKTLKGPDGKPPKIAVFELGGTLIPGDTGAGRAAWILAVIAYLRSVGCIIALWWMTGGEDLTNDPAGLAALQKAMAGH